MGLPGGLIPGLSWMPDQESQNARLSSLGSTAPAADGFLGKQLLLWVPLNRVTNILKKGGGKK